MSIEGIVARMDQMWPFTLIFIFIAMYMYLADFPKEGYGANTATSFQENIWICGQEGSQ